MQELEKEKARSVEFRVVDLSRDFAEGQRYGVTATPTYVIINASGGITYDRPGLLSRAQLLEELDYAGAP